jgi:hypothetical protein
MLTRFSLVLLLVQSMEQKQQMVKLQRAFLTERVLPRCLFVSFLICFFGRDCKRFGQQAWVVMLILLTEILISIKVIQQKETWKLGALVAWLLHCVLTTFSLDSMYDFLSIFFHDPYILCHLSFSFVHIASLAFDVLIFHPLLLLQ